MLLVGNKVKAASGVFRAITETEIGLPQILADYISVLLIITVG